MFALVWSNRALDQLAALYVDATVEERERMAAGVNALNTRLRSDPLNEGESRAGGLRVTFPALLLVTFFVREKDQLVYVPRVQRYGH
jgi:hypothetical protein